MADLPTLAPFEPFELAQYRVVELLGVGGMGSVYLAEVHGAAGFTKRVVIKRIHPMQAANAAFRAMFVDEAKVMLNLRHANVVEVLELQESAAGLFMAMEYVDGLDLNRLLKGLHARREKLPLGVAVHVASSLLAGLAHAHAATGPEGKPLNLVHRDVTPDNVLLSRNGEVKLTDFGVVRAEGRTTKTMSGEVKGKLRYMAPEVIRAEGLDRRSDVFSAGVVAWEVLTGLRLFTGRTDFHVIEAVLGSTIPPPSQFQKAVPPAMDAAVLGALERDPARRWDSARTFRKALLAAVPAFDAEEAQEHLGTLVTQVKAARPEDLEAAAAQPEEEAVEVALDGVTLSGNPTRVLAPSTPPRAQADGSLPGISRPEAMPPPAFQLERAVSSSRLRKLPETGPFSMAAVSGAGPIAVFPRPPEQTRPGLGAPFTSLVPAAPGMEAWHIRPDGAAPLAVTAESLLECLCAGLEVPRCVVGATPDALVGLDVVGRAWMLDHLQAAPWLSEPPGKAGRVSDFGIGRMLLAATTKRFTGGMVLEPSMGAPLVCAFLVDGRLAYTFKRDARDHLLGLFMLHQQDARLMLSRVLRTALGGVPLPRAMASVCSLPETHLANALEQLARRRFVEAIRGPQARFFLLPGLAPPQGSPLAAQPVLSLVPEIYFTASTADVMARATQLAARPLRFTGPMDPQLLGMLGVSADAARLDQVLRQQPVLGPVWSALVPPGSEQEQVLARTLVLLEQLGFIA